MKKIILFLTIVLFSAFSTTAVVPAFDDGDDGDEIDLHRGQNGDGPTSVYVCSIQAYKTDTQVIITFSNYYGNASAVILGIGGNVFSNQQFIDGAGILYVDISSLPSGSYSLTVFADTVYSGTFQK